MIYFGIELLCSEGMNLGIIFESIVESIEYRFNDVIEVWSFCVGYESFVELWFLHILWSFEYSGDLYFNGVCYGGF